MNNDQPGAVQPANTPHDSITALIAHTVTADNENEWNTTGESVGPEGTARRHWQAEMARWLLTLNPGRTQDEYAKAVRYFFETSGVPQDLDEITADLLLAYRGALAMRAERGPVARSTRRPTSASATRFARLWGNVNRPRDLPGDGAKDEQTASSRATPLAPATVNLRLTALRQFLRYAALRQPFEHLTPERVQHALRRLPIERRRPYQILSEDEWPAFLAAARMPLEGANSPVSDRLPAEGPIARSASPWGRTKAERMRARATQEDAAVREDESWTGTNNSDREQTTLALRRARDGRTGTFTAQRDYALAALALATGLRAIELSLLDVDDLTRERRRGQDEWWLTLPDEKTKGQRGGRTLPLAPDLIAILLDYLRATGRSLSSEEDRATPLFLALARGPRHSTDDTAPGSNSRHLPLRLRPEQIRSVINRIETQWLALQQDGANTSDLAGEGRRISPHALRHSAAIALLKGSEASGRPPASVEHVRGWLGHFDIRTTQRYLDHLNSREERRKFAIKPQAFLSPAREGESATHDGAAAPDSDE